jgi:hypothetical protein
LGKAMIGLHPIGIGDINALILNMTDQIERQRLGTGRSPDQ